MPTNYIRRKYRMRKYAGKHGLPEPEGFRPYVSGWGKPAAELLRRIQRHAKLRATGQWNDDVQALLFPKPLRLRALANARRDVGLTESPPNSNRIKYTAWFGWGPCAYCVIGSCYWYAQAGSKAVIRGSRWANTDVLLADAKARRNGVRQVSEPVPGDLVVMDFEGHSDPDHCGIVEHVHASTVTTIEPNTHSDDAGNQAEGGGVWRKTRARSMCWFIRVEK